MSVQDVAGQQGSASGPGLGAYTITGAASVTGAGVGQRIERANSFDLAGSSATLSVYLSNTLLTSVSWALYYANTNDTFGTLASPTRTLISNGTFTVTPSLARYTATVSVPGAATTGLELVLSVGAQTSGLWVIAGAQLEKGTAVSDFEQRSIEETTAECQRYYQSTRYSSGFGSLLITGQALTTTRIIMSGVVFPVVMRTAPTVTVYSGSSGSGNGAAGSVVLYNALSVAVGSSFVVNAPQRQGFGNRLDTSVGTPLTVGDWYSFTYVAESEL